MTSSICYLHSNRMLAVSVVLNFGNLPSARGLLFAVYACVVYRMIE